LSCTLDASDAKSGITWKGPDGNDIQDTTRSKYGTDNDNPNIHTLKLEADSKSGEYRCEFAFAKGTDTVPVGVFADVNFNLIEISPAKPYSTHGADVTVTLTCEVKSPSELILKFHDGSNELNPTTDRYDGGKTIAEYERAVDAASKGGTFTCRKSETEHSKAYSVLTVFSMSIPLDEKTVAGLSGSTTTLECAAQSHADVTTPTFTWFKGSNAATETPENPVVAPDESSVTSRLPITINADSDLQVYKCVATYTGLASGATNTLESSTTVLMTSE
jgi:hypothetical protein